LLQNNTGGVFALFTGMRQSEIIGLTWDYVNFDDMTLNVHRQLAYNKDTNKYY
jgi:integrase